MKRTLCVAVLVVFATLPSGCAKNLYFGTATSIGLDVSGTSTVPNKVSFAFERTEAAIVPDNSEGYPHQVFASLDSEWTWFNGFVVNQLFATGKAADIVADDSSSTEGYQPAKSPFRDKPLLFTTGTRLGINLEFGQTPQAPASLLVGYRRSEMTLMPDVAGRSELDPVYADISIIADDRGLVRTLENSPRLGGVRMKQSFATGTSAVKTAASMKVREKLRKEVIGDEVIGNIRKAGARFDTLATIKKKLDTLDDKNKQAYVKLLNETFNRTDLTPSNVYHELSDQKRMNDAQVAVAASLIKSF